MTNLKKALRDFLKPEMEGKPFTRGFANKMRRVGRIFLTSGAVFLASGIAVATLIGNKPMWEYANSILGVAGLLLSGFGLGGHSGCFSFLGISL